MSRTGSTTRDRVRPAPPPPPPPAAPRRLVLRRGRRRGLLAGALAVLLAVTAAWALLASPLLAVRTVQVDGLPATGVLTAGDVRAAAGIAPGTPLLRAGLAAAAARVRRLPSVAAVQVARGWPDRVVVTVRARVPVAVVDVGGAPELADAGGVLFAPGPDGPPGGVVPLAVAHPGPTDPATRAALAAVTALPPGLRARVTGVTATTGRDVALAVAGGPAVVWGDGGDGRAKARALAAVLDRLAAGALAPARTVDVSTPDRVVLR